MVKKYTDQYGKTTISKARTGKPGRSIAAKKGAEGEREIVRMLQPVVTSIFENMGARPDQIPKLQRNKQQSDGGGYDIIGIPGLAIEVKNRARIDVDAWWQQTCKQCGRDQLPILLYKDKRVWRARILVVISVGPWWEHTPGDIGEGAFIKWFERYVIQHARYVLAPG